MYHFILGNYLYMMYEKDILWESKASDTDSAGSSSDNNKVDIGRNRIYFYSEVNRPKNLALNKSLVTIGNSLYNRGQSLQMDPGRIYLHINSFGGSVFAGLSSVDYILNSKVPVTTVIDGCAASAATIMSVVGHHRAMHRHAFMLIHQISSAMWGKFEEMKDDMKNSELLMETIIKIYEERTRIPRSELKDILKRDLWWDAKTCLEYGLVDEII
jgi:ATP-dependent Clp protease protease subunit